MTEVKVSPEDHNRLSVFERMAMENYLTHSKQMSKGSLDNQVATTAERSVQEQAVASNWKNSAI